MIKISKVSKLDGIRSWSLPALESCPGRFNEKGNIVDACRICYATQGNYRRGNVKVAREYNMKDWKREAWVSDMITELDNDRWFRV